jgi:hypothetical protein
MKVIPGPPWNLCKSDFFIAVTKYLAEQLMGGRIYFGSQFQRVQSIMAGRTWQSRVTHIMVPREQDLCQRQGISF